MDTHVYIHMHTQAYQRKRLHSKISTSLRILRPYCSDWYHRNQKTQCKSTEMDSPVFSKHVYALNYSHHPTTGNHPLPVQISSIILLSFCVCYCLFVFQFHIQGTAQGGASGVRQTSEKNTFMITVSAWLGKHSFSFFLTRKKQNKILLWSFLTVLLLHHLCLTTAIFGKENSIYAVLKHSSQA
jgi:hypothetical protein